jgi:hypothetical protein
VTLNPLARPAILIGIAAALWLGADLLWSVGMDIRGTALDPACRLLHEREELGLDCDSQHQLGFFLAIIAPFLGFGAVAALIAGIVTAFKRGRHLFLARPVAYHSERSAGPKGGGRSHGFDVTGAAPGNADLRGDKGRYAGLSARAVRGGER